MSHDIARKMATFGSIEWNYRKEQTLLVNIPAS